MHAVHASSRVVAALVSIVRVYAEKTLFVQAKHGHGGLNLAGTYSFSWIARLLARSRRFRQRGGRPKEKDQ
jgi:hypothetical protein